jgi:hypothetical protein
VFASALIAVVLALLAPWASATSGSGSGSPLGGAVNGTVLAPARRVGAPKQVGPTLPPRRDPALPANAGDGRRVVYCNSCQWVWIVDSTNTVIRDYQVSGRIGMPSPGVYHIYIKEPWTFAMHNPTITWQWMVSFAWGPNGGGIGFHEIPWQYGHPVQTVQQLGQPLSGGCVRQKHEDAIFMWNWSQVGDTVVVTP